MAPLLTIGALLAVFVAVGLVALSGGAGAVVAGLTDPGIVTRYGITVVRVGADGAAAVCIGSLLLAAFLVPPQKSGMLAADGYAAVRTAGIAAWVWFVFALASVFFTAADGAGRPVTEVLRPEVFINFVDAIEQPKAWLWTALLALLLALGCRLILSWGWATVLFFVSVGALIPVAVTGHSASGGSHDVATNSLLFHLVGAALWVGGLVALLAHARRRGAHLPLAAARFSKIALVSWIVMAASGVINALVRVSPGQLLTTDYGLLVLGKVVALLVLGVFGHQQRQRSVRGLSEGAGGGQLVRLAAVEVLIMAVTMGLATALSRTPPPAEVAAQPSNTELLLGYVLNGEPTAWRLLTDWRFDLIFGTAAIVLAVLYLAGVRRLRKRGDTWPVGRTVAWLAACAVLLIATSSGVGRYAPAMFSIHMVNHMLLSMVVPVLLVLGGPVTLALRALPAAGRDNPPGPREWLIALVHSPISRVLTNPIVALALFVGSFYGLYYSGLFDGALEHHWAHLAMNAHFLLAGYVFYWPVIGVDPAPRRLPPLGRLGMVFASMPFHAFFGVTLMNMQTVIGEGFYRGLDLPWVGDLLTDQRLGGGIAWASGEIPVLLVMVALLVQWARADEREAKRRDRREAVTGEQDLAAYNAMLKQLADQGEPKK
ncbi:bifunctional copper resistance protein CopD/cytochrome c oxidase assembly protein [Prauserella cavernicola]|uniref:Bifunctional copper resistance protein CopD/cytochrome c oxidase assembly protein n=1 Tax=Prauserella cavernicola TaxID=2800127 RepID=A0A934V2S0_9PSEU|nr:bifunctional copper resistance protein CopD/cytochrome c oxidase assembly protein [Prauserella cavernicola]MBK1786356.1 bifunctional copper resistance protein CopD/cytochrome c oxidase assembly protein [Prauserella cavernicola]